MGQEETSKPENAEIAEFVMNHLRVTMNAGFQNLDAELEHQTETLSEIVNQLRSIDEIVNLLRSIEGYLRAINDDVKFLRPM